MTSQKPAFKFSISKNINIFTSLFLIFFSASDLLADQRCETLFNSSNQAIPPLFATNQTLSISLTADFGAIAKTVEADFDQGDSKDTQRFYKGAIGVNGQSIAVSVRGNGSTSAYKDEADFPKLKLKFTNSGEDSYFKGVSELYVNTHMKTVVEHKLSPLGRLVDGHSPFREALVYDLANMIGIETGGYRRAWIQYQDVNTQQTFQRQALLLESHQALAKRLQGTFDGGSHVLNVRNVSPAQKAMAVRIHLFQTLIGNEDFGYDLIRKAAPTFKFQPYKNMAMVKFKSKDFTPVVYDFDMATIVAGYQALHPWRSLAEFGIPNRGLAFTVHHFLKLRTEFYEADLRPEIDRILKLIPKFKKMIDEADVDPEGKDIAKAHLDTFVQAASMAYDPSLYFIQGTKTQFYEKPDGKGSKLEINKIQGTKNTLRPGTPFRILEESGDYLKIVILDIKFDLDNGQSPIGYIKKSSPIGHQILQDNLPVVDQRDFL